MADVWTDEYNEGYDACEEGLSEWDCPYAEGTYAATQWLSGWHSANFDDRAADVIQAMENGYGFF